MAVSLKIHVEPMPEGMWADGRRVEAFEEMYRRCYPRLVDLCRRHLCGRGDPEAVAQEAFVRAWSSLDRFSGARPFWPWVATIARRLCIDHRRRLEREAQHLHTAATMVEGDAVPPDERLEEQDERRSALLALGRLKPAEQRVIAMRDLNGWSYEQIATFEGVTVESIRGSLKRARASLRQSYSRVSAGAPAVIGIRLSRALRRRGRGFDNVLRAHPVVASGADLAAGALAAALAVLVPGASVTVPDVRQAPVERGVAAPVPAATPDVESAAAHGGKPTQAPRGNSSSNSGVRAPLPVSLPSDGASAPEDTVVTAIAPSPSYEDDKVMYAVGTVGVGCPYGPCAVLFRSADGGVSWSRPAATGFAGGTILFSPTFAVDNTIYAAGPVGLQVSRDGGHAFDLVSPLAGDAAIAPVAERDGARVLIGHAPVWEYREDLDVTRPAGFVVPSSALITTPLFSPGYASDHTIFLGATVIDAAARQRSAVFRCNDSVCGDASVLPGVVGSPMLATDGKSLAAWRGQDLFVSHDDAASFVRVTLPVAGFVTDVAFDGMGRVFVSTRGTIEGGVATGGVSVSHDGGRTFAALPATPETGSGVEAIAVVGDRIVAAPSGASGGVVCSMDGGTTWTRRCAG